MLAGLAGAAADQAPGPGPVAEPDVVAAVTAPETDLRNLVLKAHPVVQGVMALLAAAVFVVLTVFLFKLVEFAVAFALLSRSARGQNPVATRPLALTATAARTEVAALSAPLTPALRASARERLDLSLTRIERLQP